MQSYSGGHTSQQYHGSVKFTVDGNKYIATGSEDGAVVLYDASTRKVACRTEVGGINGHSMPVISIDVTKERMFVSGSADGAIKLWQYRDKSN